MNLTEKIHLLKIDFEIAIAPGKSLPRFVNVLVIFGERITLVDTGVKGSQEKIFDYIRQFKRDVSDIGSIILSHSHPDHIGSAHAIKKLTNCEIFSHENEADWIEDIDLQNKLRPVPGFYNLVDQSVRIDGKLHSGQELKVAEDITLEIVHAPGHSKGSLNIMFKESGILFTADSIPLKNDIPNYDNFPDLKRSLNNIKENNRYKTLLTSWTPPLTDKTESKKLISEGENYILKIDEAVKEIYVGNESEPLSFCRKTIEKLGLPPFLVTPVVERAFRSHLVTDPYMC